MKTQTNATTNETLVQDWCVVGSYTDDDGYPMIEVMADGYRTQQAASESADLMRDRCPEIRYDVHQTADADAMGWVID